MKRVFAMAVVATVIGVAPTSASAVTSVVKQSAATAVLTDCPARPSIGTVCSAWIVNASTFDVNSHHASALSVTVLRQTWTPSGYTSVVRGGGGSQVELVINLTSGQARAAAAVSVVLDCRPTSCTRTTLNVDVKWFAVGPTTVTGHQSDETNNGCRVRIDEVSSVRPAAVAARIGGRRVSSTPVPLPVTLSSVRTTTTTTGCP